MSQGPVPVPTPETLQFWEGTAVGELRIQRCNSCEKFYFYPRPYCPKCNSDNVEWRVVSGKGSLASYNINYRPFPMFGTEEPQVIALVELDEGVRLMTNVVGIEPVPENLPLGLRVQVAFEPRGDQFLPVFTPDTAATIAAAASALETRA
ncbi:Zn-ribbon domain-containing OB-fold protein [Humibacter sp. RRB41]|uniref:Zn-ribbon domain-containing OB-fold protein n=1 Tax=Humibacter sp. RRB41 TaxID=2919946 RepID=UPI001FAAC3B0|nr:Zn-ribbon domain-containing OB-fold protein [Humibacter sp. RRB41]